MYLGSIASKNQMEEWKNKRRLPSSSSLLFAFSFFVQKQSEVALQSDSPPVNIDSDSSPLIEPTMSSMKEEEEENIGPGDPLREANMEKASKSAQMSKIKAEMEVKQNRQKQIESDRVRIREARTRIESDRAMTREARTRIESDRVRIGEERESVGSVGSSTTDIEARPRSLYAREEGLREDLRRLDTREEGLREDMRGLDTREERLNGETKEVDQLMWNLDIEFGALELSLQESAAEISVIVDAIKSISLSSEAVQESLGSLLKRGPKGECAPGSATKSKHGEYMFIDECVDISVAQSPVSVLLVPFCEHGMTVCLDDEYETSQEHSSSPQWWLFCATDNSNTPKSIHKLLMDNFYSEGIYYPSLTKFISELTYTRDTSEDGEGEGEGEGGCGRRRVYDVSERPKRPGSGKDWFLSGNDIFGSDVSTHGVAYPLNGRPEVCVKPFTEHLPTMCFVPGFQAEGKTLDGASFSELSLSLSMSVCHTHFCTNYDVKSDGTVHRFFKHPPIGFGLYAVGPIGWIFVAEMIGKLFLRPFGRPFILESGGHKEMILEHVQATMNEYMNKQEVKEEVQLGNMTAFEKCKQYGECITWTTRFIADSHGMKWFYKFIKGHGAYHSNHYRHIYRVYKQYEDLAPWDVNRYKNETDEDTMKGRKGLLPAELMFGHVMICVKMKWSEGTRVKNFETKEGRKYRIALINTLKALYFSGFIHVDPLPSNVLALPDGLVHLIDYDDMVVFNPSYAHDCGWEKLLDKYDHFWENDQTYPLLGMRWIESGIVNAWSH